MMKRNFLYMVCLVALAACNADDVPTNLEPRLTAGEATDITRNEATLSGTIAIDGNSIVPTLNFVYGTTQEMTATAILEKPYGEILKSPLQNLKAGTTYYFALQGTHGNATLQSNISVFTTLPNVKPTIGEIALLSSGPLSAIVKFNISDDGGEEMENIGCYVKNVPSGTTRKIFTSTTAITDGECKMRIDSLERYTAYEIKPFAENTIGETVGEAITYTTSDAVTLETGGELSLLIGDDIADYESLSIAGNVNGDDIACLRAMMSDGNLSTLDMTDAVIVSGGGTYGYSRYTEDDVITYGMFGGCAKLVKIALPDNAVRIDGNAFIDCTSLATLVVPATAADVSPSSGCTSLAAIEVSAANSHYQSVDGVLYDAGVTRIVWLPLGKTGSYAIPETVTAIGERAFEGSKIERLTLPDNLADIGFAAFYGSSLVEITMPSTSKSIATATFQGCEKLTTVHLGSGMEIVNEYAFDGCPLTDLYVDAVYPPVCYENTFTSSASDIPKTCTLHVPQGSKTIYRNHKYWGTFEKIVE